MKKGVLLGTPLVIASISSSCSSEFNDNDLTQKMLDEESRRKFIVKKQKLETKLNMGKEHHLGLSYSYLDEVFKNVEVMHYRMYIDKYKNTIVRNM